MLALARAANSFQRSRIASARPADSNDDLKVKVPKEAPRAPRAAPTAPRFDANWPATSPSSNIPLPVTRAGKSTTQNKTPPASNAAEKLPEHRINDPDAIDEKLGRFVNAVSKTMKKRGIRVGEVPAKDLITLFATVIEHCPEAMLTLNEHYQQQRANACVEQDGIEQLGSALSNIDVNKKRLTVVDLCDYDDERGFAIKIPPNRTQAVTWLALCCPVCEWSPLFSKYTSLYDHFLDRHQRELSPLTSNTKASIRLGKIRNVCKVWTVAAILEYGPQEVEDLEDIDTTAIQPHNDKVEA